jgi:uncharacterized protein (DUF58 family)
MRGPAQRGGLFARLKAWVRGRVRERVTVAGLVFLCATALTGFAAFASANNLLFLLLAAMLATLVVSGFIAKLGIAALELDVQLPDHIPARRAVAARILLRNLKRRMPSFSIRLTGTEESVFSAQLYFPVIPGGATLETTVDVVFPRRGLYGHSSFLFSSRFPFGFAERRSQVRMEHDILVYPCLDPAPGFEDTLKDLAGEADARFRGRSHDFYRIRPYQPLESARHVDWRATAHTGSMQVREFAREQEHLITIFLDLEAPAELRDWFEKAVDLAAYLAWEFSDRGARVRFRTQDFEVFTPAQGDVHDILRYLALVECRPAVAPLANLNQESVAVVLAARPGRLREMGWEGARVFSLATDPAAGSLPEQGEMDGADIGMEGRG